MKRLFTAAKVHKLDRVAVGYLVAAWVVVQAGSIALPAFEAPVWGMKLLIAAAVVGLPLTLLVAWFWRIGSEADSPEDNAPHPFWGRSELILVGLLAFVLVTGALEFALFFTPKTAPRPRAATMSQASIAVLPFANLSGDPGKRYFSDGIADQLISELSKTPALHVASRTSSFALARKDMDVKALGRTLDVKTVLEGSVREEGGRVRIAAQLVNASDGFEVWSNTYDRNLTDILSLQDEIAHSITQALTRHLLGKVAVADAPQHPKPKAIAPDAYRDFLQGQYFFAQRTPESIARAIDLFAKTTQAAPDFADGYAALADAHATIAFNFEDETHIPAALYAVKQALALDSDNITALAAHATLSLSQWKWLSAAQDIRKLQRLGPNSAQVWHNSSIFYAYMGLPDLAIDAAKRAAELDPLSFIDRANVAVFEISQRRYEEGMTSAREALALQPGGVDALGTMCEVLAASKKLDEAKKILAQIASLSDETQRPGPRAACEFWIALNSGDKAAAHRIVDGVLPGYPDNQVQAGDISTAYRFLGENDEALKWYIRALDKKESAMLQMPYLGKGPREVFNTAPWLEVRKRPDVQAFENAREKVAAEFIPRSRGT